MTIYDMNLTNGTFIQQKCACSLTLCLLILNLKEDKED